ncbi:MAG: T9SS type A sorting domain-containing protein [Candidatus Hatepunaea meridiana]|nr:T9SS type A sorting domain-containing protein [Candidatus Hatepunaea meridiana]
MKQLRIFIVAVAALGLILAGTAFSDNTDQVKSDTNCQMLTPDATTSNVKQVPISMPNRDNPDETLFEEDFEDGLDEWTSHDLTNPDIAWHQSDYMTDEDDLLWWCGDTLTQYDGDPVGYDNIWLQYLDTPVLNLSGAGDNLTLTFDAYWLLEDPRRVPPPDGWDGWDGWLVMISEDGGDEFEVLNPESPEYTADHLSAADRFWDLGELPGWVFESEEGGRGDWEAADDTVIVPHWVEVEFDLSDYNSEEVVIRFLLVSDRTVSAPWNYYLRNSGVFIDNLLITDDDEEVYLFNDGVEDPVPDELIPRRGAGFGDEWALTNESSHEGDWSLWNDDDNHNFVNAIDSPPFEIPADLTVWFEFWVWCDLPDYDSNGDNRLEDFYQIYVSDDEGETWEYVIHDWKRAASGGNGWVHYIPGTSLSGNIEHDLSDYENETIQLRWVFLTDNNDGDGNGDGLFIDDIEVIGVNSLLRDTGMDNFDLSYPVIVGLRTNDLTVECHNYGLRDQDNIYAWWRWGNDEIGRTYPIIPRPGMTSGEFIVLEISDYVDRRNPGWTPTIPGVYDLATYTALGSNTPGDDDDDDENFNNDTARVADIRVWPAGLYELGHDNRTYQYAFSFDPGQGPATRFSPGDIDSVETYSLASAHFRFNGGQNGSATFRLHIFGSGDESTPGDELLSFEVEVPADSCLPNHMTVPLYEHEELQGLDGDFWLWAENQREDFRPQMIGDDQLRGEGRYFKHDGENTVAYERDLLMHAMIVPTQEVIPDLVGSLQTVEFDEVYLGESATINYTIYSRGLSPLTISNVSASEDVFSVDWDGEVTLYVGQMVSFDITFEPVGADEYVGSLIIESNDEETDDVYLLGFGLGVSDDPNQNLPVKFGLVEPYPNPFNSITRLDFSLEAAGTTSLSLYDLSGRNVRQIANGWMASGRHITTLKAENLPSGVYLVKLQSGDKTAVKKVALLR